MFITGLVVGLLIAVLVVMVVMPKQMFVTHESKLDFNGTVDAITSSVQENNWSMPHQYDLQATMEKHGFSVKPVKVFSICKPEHAYQILSGDEERMASALMPCRIAVYEKNDKTFISILNAGLFSKFMGSEIRKVMGAASDENMQILADIVK